MSGWWPLWLSGLAAVSAAPGHFIACFTLAGKGTRELEMDAAEYVVPAVLRDAMFVPDQAAGRPGPRGRAASRRGHDQSGRAARPQPAEGAWAPG